MCDDEQEELLRQLRDDNWLNVALALGVIARRRLDVAAMAIQQVFASTFSERSAISDIAEVTCRKLGKVAVPFLLTQAASPVAAPRRQSLRILMYTGQSHVPLSTQTLGPRATQIPDWGDHADDVKHAFNRGLVDTDLSVRFVAACAMEEYNWPIERAIPIFIDVLKLGDPSSQHWAALYLGRIGPTAASACEALRLRTTSTDNHGWVGTAARNAMKQIGCP